MSVISSSPTDVQPVFDAIVRNAGRLCEAASAALNIVEGDVQRKVAEFGPESFVLRIGETRPIIRTSLAGRIEALQRLRADPVTRPTPVIAIRALVMTQDRMLIMAAGFDGFRGKPISVKELLATVREIRDKSVSTGAAPYYQSQRPDSLSTRS